MSIINTKIHTTVAAALRCKLGNQTLSPRTLKLLTGIANREFGGDATRVFGKASPGIGRFNGDAAGLRSAISSQLLHVRSPQLASVMRQWLAQLPAPTAHAQLSALPHGAGRAPAEPTPDYPGALTGARTASLLKEPAPDYAGAEPRLDYQRVEYGRLATVVDAEAQSHQVETRREDGGSPPRRVAQPDGGSTGVVKGGPLLKQFVQDAADTRFSTGEMTRFWEAALSVPEISAVMPQETLEGVVRLLEYPGAWANYQLGVTAVRPEQPVPPSAAMLAAVIQAAGVSFE
ncbi:hypothetical protein [Stenotrophomonas sp. PD6]|uniref:hypothetical protein n=1 Tax=Stenotrophomonas sp. PD6 TaxID=3368612 RepID=UPI003B9FC135